MICPTAEEFAAALPRAGAIAGLDLGTKTIGVAVSDGLRQVASPLTVIRREKFTLDAAALLRIAEDRALAGIILGLPRNMDGTEGPRAQSTRAFARNLERLTPLPLSFWDERLSTVAAERAGSAGGAGRPLVINVWAQWCGPCKTELPYFEEFAARAGDRVTVLALHAKEGGSNPFFPLTLLTEIGVRLPSVLDLDGKVAAAINAPRVFPSTVFLRPDGTVAEVYPGVFDSPEEIADSVAEHLGVRI